MKSFPVHFLISLTLLDTGAAAQAESAFYPSTTDSLYFGRGYDPVKGSVLGPCVADKPTSPVGLGGPGQRVDMEFIRVDDYSTLRRKVDFSASISARWGLAQASASLDYMESHDFTSNDTYLLTHVRVQNNTIGLTSPSYTEAAADLRANDPEGFYSACGTEFVSTMVAGGQFDAILHIFTTSTEDRKNVIAAFSGSYSGIAGAAKFQEELTKVRKNHRVELHLLRIGGTGDLPAVGPDSVVEYALKFPTLVGGQGAPLVYLVGTQSYSSIVAKAGHPSPRDARSPWMEDAIDNFEEAMLRRNDVGYALEHPLQFDRFDVTKAKVKLAELDAYLKQLRQAAKTCSQLDRKGTCPPFAASLPSSIDLNRYDHLEVVTHSNMTEALAAPMPPGYSCRLVSITGVWYPWRRDPGAKYADCSQIKVNMNEGGTFASSDFDSSYSDNSGECVFQFGCFIKSQFPGSPSAN